MKPDKLTQTALTHATEQVNSSPVLGTIMNSVTIVLGVAVFMLGAYKIFTLFATTKTPVPPISTESQSVMLKLTGTVDTLSRTVTILSDDVKDLTIKVASLDGFINGQESRKTGT